MDIGLVLIFSVITLAALAFVCWPLWHHTERGRMVLIGSLAAFVLAIAAGAYVFVGHPQLAVRALEKPKATDVPALVSSLAWQMRKAPNDPRGWMLLGKGYLTLNDPADAAGAFRRAVFLAPPAAKPALLSAYGEALTMAAGGVTDDAAAAFQDALRGDPMDYAARYYLGQAYAERRDTAHALSMWESLLADTPAGAPWREELLDRIAILKGTTRAAPDIAAMVQGLADRLKAHPNDPVGWRRLVKAYVVLGDTQKAQAALADAKRALTGNRREIAALDAQARTLKLEK